MELKQLGSRFLLKSLDEPIPNRILQVIVKNYLWLNKTNNSLRDEIGICLQRSLRGEDYLSIHFS